MAGSDLSISADRTADVDRDDVRAFLSEPDCVTATLAARRASNECDLALHPSRHNASLPRFAGGDLFTRSRSDLKLFDRSGTMA